MWSKDFPGNPILGFLNQLYLKSNWVNQSDFLHVVIHLRKIKGDLKIFS